MVNFSSAATKVPASGEVSARIGLEIHIRLASTEKIFNFNSNLLTSEDFANSVEAWELGYLGTLPVLNDEVIKLALKTCLFLNAKVSRRVTFDRKVYNYFDLPKGFQITQQENPIGKDGYFILILGGKAVVVPISRIQLEEDTAKSSYREVEIMLDFSRSGTPLLEIVTEPVFSDIDSVVSFIKQFQSALNYIGVSGAKMEQGELRIDLNFSFAFDQHYQTPRYEMKNLNSIRNLKMSFQQELEKHLLIYKNRSRRNCSLESQTLGFNEATDQTFVQRKKTNYFYLPESNIPTVLVDNNEIAALQKEMPVNLFSVWSKLERSGNSHYSTMLFEKPLFARIVNSFEKEGIDYSTNFASFTTFFFNYLSVNIQGHNDNEIIQFFDGKARYLWSLFIFFEKKLLAKEKINSLIAILFAECEDYSISQWENLLEKEGISKEGPVLDIEKEIANILVAKKVSRKLAGQPSRIANFLLGNLKNKFPSSSFDYQEIFKIANNLAAELTK